MAPISSVDNQMLGRAIVYAVEAKLGSLPTKGILAGQAVASAVYEFVGSKLRGQYNDADIYIDSHCNMDDYAGLDDENLVRKPSLNRCSKNAVVHGSMYAIELGRTVKAGYRIDGVGYSTLNSNINFIRFSRTGLGVNGEDNCELVINGFDINAVQVCVDLHTKKVTWTPEFEAFLFDGEIKLVTYATPMHSAVRLLNKQASIENATLDVEREVSKLAVVRSVLERLEETKLEEHQYTVGCLFSELSLAKYEVHKKTLDKFFTVMPKEIRVYNGASMLGEMKLFHVLSVNERYNKADDILSIFDINCTKGWHIDGFVSVIILISELMKSECTEDKERLATLRSSMDRVDEVMKKNNLDVHDCNHLKFKLMFAWEADSNLKNDDIKQSDVECLVDMHNEFPNLFNDIGAITTSNMFNTAKSYAWLKENDMRLLLAFYHCGVSQVGVKSFEKDLLEDAYKRVLEQAKKNDMECFAQDAIEEWEATSGVKARQIVSMMDYVKSNVERLEYSIYSWENKRYWSDIVIEITVPDSGKFTICFETFVNKDDANSMLFWVDRIVGVNKQAITEKILSQVNGLVTALNDKRLSVRDDLRRETNGRQNTGDMAKIASQRESFIYEASALPF